MMAMLTGVMVLYMMILVVIMVFFLRNRFLAESQQKEITYLKEINHGMEMLVQKNNEIRHYQRIQSLGMMASHIAHEFNNYLTPVLIYAELLENDESISSENQEMIHEITKSVDQASNLSKELLAFSTGYRCAAGTAELYGRSRECGIHRAAACPGGDHVENRDHGGATVCFRTQTDGGTYPAESE